MCIRDVGKYLKIDLNEDIKGWNVSVGGLSLRVLASFWLSVELGLEEGVR